MRFAFYSEVTGAVAALVLAWSGLSTLPPTGWIYNAVPGEDAWTLKALALALVGLAAAVLLARRAIARPMPLPPIPGVPARTGGVVAFVLALIGSLMLFWWIVAGRDQLPVGPVGWALGALALGTLAWCSMAAGALWTGPEAEREKERSEARPGTPVGL
jgi:hypothetical protein